ncbi:hypothetical protein [Zavarzinia sp.]|uniref:hypothetical protein n=1 Tax=Zavarzinia sp. TaxID=2027920 RepID=UPI003564547E
MTITTRYRRQVLPLALFCILTVAGCEELPGETPPAAVADMTAAPGAGPSAAAPSGLSLALGHPAWTGGAVPDGQQCTKFGGVFPRTPALMVRGLPLGTTQVVVEFNDADYAPLSSDGGHGKLAFEAGPGDILLPAVPGETTRLPPGVKVVAGNRATGDFAKPGYLPPCSGGAGHRYFAVVKAVGPHGKTLAEGEITIGTY